MLRTLYGRLAASLLALLGFLGLSYLVVGYYGSRALAQEVNQTLNRDVARHLVSELPLMKDGRVNHSALESAFHMMMVVNPTLEIYLLDPGGRILAYSAEPGKVRLESVDVGRIRKFLDQSGGPPLLGDDPRNPGRQKAFSAAVVGDPGRPEGYLYVVLGGESYDSALRMFQASYILKAGAAAVLVSLLVTFAAGLLLFRLITRRLRRLSDTVERFEAEGFARPLDIPAGVERPGDEIDRLNASFAQMSRRMVDMLREVRQADETRRELVASVSHDLRTPLASLQGSLETLLLKEDRLDPPERRRYVESALRHGEQLGKLVSALFELAKLESPAARIRPEDFSLPELVQDVVQKHQLAAERGGIRLEAETGEALPFVSGDIALIERALENLLDNAIRYTPAGGRVGISVRRGGDGIDVRVEDTGPGIPAEAIPRVFDRFYRVEGPAGGKSPGSGLGLAITRRIVELHGGRIEAASRPGAGAAFTFRLPLRPA